MVLRISHSNIGEVGMGRQFLDYGADVNKTSDTSSRDTSLLPSPPPKDIYGLTPLMEATSEGDVEFDLKLLDHGADANAKTEQDIVKKISKMWGETVDHIVTIALQSSDDNAKKIIGRYNVRDSNFWSDQQFGKM